MNSKHTTYILLGLILAVTAAGISAYPSLPEQVASHWNAAGEADGYAGKFWGTFLLPLLMAGMFLLYFFIPKLDPLKKNIDSFRSAYNAFWILICLFLSYIFCLALAWNFGYRFSFTVAIVPALAALLYVTGGVLEKSKRNWFMGIRTPWTLSSDIVWNKTHKLGGRLFKAAAIVSLAGMVVPGSYVLGAVAVPVALVAVVTILYSYIEYKKLY